MKVLVAIITAILAGSMGSFAFAQVVMGMDQYGEYRVAFSVDHWETANIHNATDEAQRYVEGMRKALNAPGKFVPVETREVSTGMVSPFGLKRDLVAYTGVMYDQNKEDMKMVNDPTVLESAVVFNPFLVWYIIALVALISLSMRRSEIDAPIFDISASAFMVFGIVFALVAVNTIRPILSTILFFVSIIPMAMVVGRQEGREKNAMYWTASIAIYGMLAVLLYSVYTT